MKKIPIVPALLVVLGLVPIRPALANEVTVSVSAPVDGTVTLVIGGTQDKKGNVTGGTWIPVDVKKSGGETGKRDAIIKAVEKAVKENSNLPKYGVAADGDNGVKITGLAKGTLVVLLPGATGEKKDTTTAFVPLGGSFGFGNTAFASLDAFGNTSVFTGGIITDVGELSLSIPASSLPALDGTTITQALFAALNPSALLYGATITNGGDFLEFAFDPAKTTHGGGVVFGTTALTDGVFGAVTAGDAVPEPATLFLLGSGLAGVAAFRKRRGLIRPE
jgi:hypothetical protein